MTPTARGCASLSVLCGASTSNVADTRAVEASWQAHSVQICEADKCVSRHNCDRLIVTGAMCTAELSDSKRLRRLAIHPALHIVHSSLKLHHDFHQRVIIF